ncbi:pilus assembly protein CpaE [Trinickia terrae]|uniref:Pilus assembly protein CpaE n=1 Tax=Trinickia terrae TaxID=2571161 RepID=A0A4U1IFT9_9BURK|nr:AAA family ATPase [Trinickia terrae]TKC92598.1 pilus assembly protein CpaE [Trinickia terrae]
MIDILLISTDEARAARIAAMLKKNGVDHRLRTAPIQARQLKQHAEAFKSADLLIVDDDELTALDLSGIEEALVATPRLSCMLVTPSLSKEQLMAAMRAGVRHVLSWPLNEQQLDEELAHLATKRISGVRREGRVLSFVSCRGGSGATFIAVNLAYALAAMRDKRVLLLDLNRQFADASLLLADQVPTATLADLCAQIDRLDAAFFDGCVMRVHPNLDVLAGAGDPIKAAELRPAQLERVLELVRPRYDAVIVDVGQTIDPLSMLALDQSYAICAVLRQTIPQLHAARRLLRILLELGYPSGKVRLLVNQYDKSAQLSLATLEETLAVRAAHLLPRDEKHADLAVNHGAPLLTIAKNSALAQSLAALGEQLWPQPETASKSVLKRLFAPKTAEPHQLKTES